MKTEKLAKWLEERYSILWMAFKESNFRFGDAAKVLEESEKQDRWEEIPVFLSELKKAGWLTVELDRKDSRKRIYKLVSKEKAIRGLLSINKTNLGRTEVDSILKKAADLIRTRVDYKFILILLFLKRISDKWEIEYEEAYKEALADGLSEFDAQKEAKNGAFHDFDLPEEYLWDNIRKDVDKLPERLSRGLKIIAERNPELKDIVDSIDFVQFTANSENAEILRQLIELFSERKLHDVSSDILGDAYEWILRYFAPTKAKEGEIYTPREVIELLVDILDPMPEESVYDPACGSAGMLIASYKHVEDRCDKTKAETLFLYGQEVNQKTIALARMNMYIHDIRNCDLAFGDAFLYPKFIEEDQPKKFDVVIANPPWNQDGYDEDVLKRGEFWQRRFKFGFVPKQSADWAWIQHMLASSKDDSGRIGIIIDTGCLFRGGKEEAIRTQIVEADLIECIILLPKKLFYNTTAPGAIIILRKNKPAERKGKILFIDASSKFEQHPDVRKLNMIGEQHIKELLDAYANFSELAEFSRIGSLEEIKENEYNLGVNRYVKLVDEGSDVDVARAWQELTKLESEQRVLAMKLNDYLKELDYGTKINHKQTTPDELPQGWEIKKLKDFSTEFISGGTPSTSNESYWNGNIPWMRSAWIGGMFVDSAERYISQEGIEKSSTNIVPKDNILIATRVCLGNVAVNRIDIAISQDLTGVVIDKQHFSLEYVYWALKSVESEIKRLAQGSTIQGILREDLENLRIAIPSARSEQEKIASILSDVNSTIQKSDEVTEKIQRLKKGLMRDLLTGQTRVAAI